MIYAERVIDVEPVKKEKLQKMVLSILESGDMTAREVAIELRDRFGILNGTRQDVAPRLTELEDKGLVFVNDVKYDPSSKKNVSVYGLEAIIKYE